MHFLEKRYFFFPKIIYFFFRQKMKDDHSQKIHGNMTFSVYIYIYVTNIILPFCHKKERWSSLEEILLKVTFPASLKKIIENIVFLLKCHIDWILDRHSRKSSNNSLYFYEDLYRRFYRLLSSEKIPQT